MTRYIFQASSISHVDAIMTLIQERMDWMDQKGIQHWNVSNYLEHYTKNYFESAAEAGILFHLWDAKEAVLVGALTLHHHDDRWTDGEPARYVHNLVTHPSYKGLGDTLLKGAIAATQSGNCSRLRLDCQAQSDVLNAYYDKAGFPFVRQIAEGNRHYNLREMRLQEKTD